MYKRLEAIIIISYMVLHYDKASSETENASIEQILEGSHNLTGSLLKEFSCCMWRDTTTCSV